MARNIIYWLPRFLGAAFVLFLSVFALDVFSEYQGMQAILPFLIHLLPALVLLGVMVLAWKHELVGAIVFVGFAIFYVLGAGFDRPWSWYAVVALPAAGIGILFLIGWFQRHGRRRSVFERNSL